MKWGSVTNNIVLRMYSRLAIGARTPARRLYAQVSASPAGSKTSRFDKSMIKPALVVIIFGSLLNHVSTQQKRNAELERRYDLKIHILNELIERAMKGDTDFDLSEELMLVNKLFSRHASSKYASLGEEAGKLRDFYEGQAYSKKEVLDSMNSATGSKKEESLDELLKGIMEQATDKVPIKSTQKKDTKSLHTSEEIVANKDILMNDAKIERDLLNYKPSTEVHLIVETPGDVSSAAKDTKVTKFL